MMFIKFAANSLRFFDQTKGYESFKNEKKYFHLFVFALIQFLVNSNGKMKNEIFSKNFKIRAKKLQKDQKCKKINGYCTLSYSCEACCMKFYKNSRIFKNNIPEGIFKNKILT